MRHDLDEAMIVLIDQNATTACVVRASRRDVTRDLSNLTTDINQSLELWDPA